VDPTSTTIIITILVNRGAVETMPRTKSTDELRNESRTMKRDIIQVMEGVITSEHGNPVDFGFH
jgi:hypothetical protein